MKDTLISQSDIDFNHQLRTFKEKAISGAGLTEKEAQLIVETPNLKLLDLLAAANDIREKFFGRYIDLCAIVNAKSGACSEDCAFCAQSAHFKTKISVYPLLDKETILKKAEEAKNGGVSRFSIVTSGKRINKRDLIVIGSLFHNIRRIGLLPCASLGTLSKDELQFLKEEGLDRYHHNIESSERFFPMICSTHSYKERIRTIENALSVGLSVCSGGIFGMGETWEDRIDMALLLKDLNVSYIPVNFLIPIEGTPLALKEMLHPFEALKIICLFRFMLPNKSIRICGGRVQVLKEFHSLIFMAGADSILTGNYLTTIGRTFADDYALIRSHDLLPVSHKN
ncbi:MAG: biotin synthase BioB [Thermodesulfovibrionales bacterium]|nr:biotin synthase BioB [Thermodesulfovibrionales bacterium]